LAPVPWKAGIPAVFTAENSEVRRERRGITETIARSRMSRSGFVFVVLPHNDVVFLGALGVPGGKTSRTLPSWVLERGRFPGIPR
jgi:hypothetical protein